MEGSPGERIGRSHGAGRAYPKADGRQAPGRHIELPLIGFDASDRLGNRSPPERKGAVTAFRVMSQFDFLMRAERFSQRSP